MPAPTGRRLGTLARIGLSAAVFLLVLSFIDLAQFRRVLSTVSPAWFAFALAAALGFMLLGGFVVSALCDGAVTPLAVARVNLISVYFGTFVPGDVAAGLVSRLRYLGLASWQQVVQVSLLERMIGLAMLSVLAAALLHESTYWRVLGPATASIPLAVLAACALGIAVMRDPQPLLRRLPMLVALHARLRGAQPGVARVRPSAFLWSLASQSVTCLVTFAVFRSIHLAIGYADCVAVAYFLTLAQLLPFFFAGIGIRDVSAVALLAVLGIRPDVAVAFSTLLLGVTLVLALVGGLLQLGAEGKGPRP